MARKSTQIVYGRRDTSKKDPFLTLLLPRHVSVHCYLLFGPSECVLRYDARLKNSSFLHAFGCGVGVVL